MQIYLITKSGYGIKVDIAERELETLKKQLASGDTVTEIEES